MKATITLEIEIGEDDGIDAAYRHTGALLEVVVTAARESGATITNASATIPSQPRPTEAEANRARHSA